MPLNPDDGTLKYYEQPYPGQPFMRVQNENSVEYGMVSGVTTVGEYIDHEGKRKMGWTALLQCRLHGEHRFSHRDSWISPDSWHPMTAKDLEKVRGAAGFADVVSSTEFAEFTAAILDKLTKVHALHEQAIGVLEERVAALVKRVDALTPLTPASPPLPTPANGRTPRVPA